jgi:RNA polymerase sigma-70 factor (ECF subfamily)
MQLVGPVGALSLETEGEVPDDREAKLIERARGGDVEAWARLYKAHSQGILLQIAYLTGNPHANEDLVQETFASAIVSLRHFQSRGSFHGWLRGIALNIVRNYWRGRERGGRAMEHLATMVHDRVVGPDEDPEGTLCRQRRAEALFAVLETLPAPLREAYVLCDLREMSPEEAMAELGVSLNNLRVRAARARARIREELTRLGWIPNPSISTGRKRDDVGA